MLDEQSPWSRALRQGTQRRESFWEGAEELGSEKVTLISSITLGGMGASLSIEGSADRESFSLYLEEVLCPALRRGQIVVMDNLSVHKSRYVRELIERRGCELWFLPAYSPDLNPIEEAFSKAKGILKKAKARTLPALLEATA